MSEVLITQEIDPIGLTLLEEAGIGVRLRRGPAPIERAELLRLLEGCAGVMPMPTDRIDEEVLSISSLRIVANHAVGVDNVDLAAARERGIVVTNTPGVLTDATADLALALILAAARRVVEGDRLARAGGFLGWRPTLLRGLALRGAILGIVGDGRIGRATAARAEAFGMEILFAGRGRGVALPELLESSDVVSLHCPLTPETHHLIDEAALARMKPTAVLVNTARGPVVDEAALARALREGRIAGAALDVFEEEPKVHPELLGLDNVILAPHIGSATYQSRRAMAELAAKNLVAFLTGEEAITRIV